VFLLLHHVLHDVHPSACLFLSKVYRCQFLADDAKIPMTFLSLIALRIFTSVKYRIRRNDIVLMRVDLISSFSLCGSVFGVSIKARQHSVTTDLEVCMLNEKIVMVKAVVFVRLKLHYIER
jgi:hypothetical protein